MSIWKTKPLSVLLNEASEDEKGLKEHYQQDPLLHLELDALWRGIIFINWNYCSR
jgi:APA family basic amino acid/polyamine antiporter